MSWRSSGLLRAVRGLRGCEAALCPSRPAGTTTPFRAGLQSRRGSRPRRYGRPTVRPPGGLPLAWRVGVSLRRRGRAGRRGGWGRRGPACLSWPLSRPSALAGRRPRWPSRRRRCLGAPRPFVSGGDPAVPAATPRGRVETVVMYVVHAVAQVLPLVSLLRVEGEQVRRRGVPFRREDRLGVPLDTEDAVDLVFEVRERVRGGRIPVVVLDAPGASVLVLDRGQAAGGAGELAVRVLVLQAGVTRPLEGLSQTLQPPPGHLPPVGARPCDVGLPEIFHLTRPEDRHRVDGARSVAGGTLQGDLPDPRSHPLPLRRLVRGL